MFGDNLIRLRKNAGLTQETLANGLRKIAGEEAPSRSSIAMYESGKRKPSFEMLELLADYFNVTLSTLVGDEGNPIIVQLSNDLTDNEVAEVVNYILYLKSKRGDAN